MNKKKIKPNDLCPCGSGKKYKKCCNSKITNEAYFPEFNISTYMNAKATLTQAGILYENRNFIEAKRLLELAIPILRKLNSENSDIFLIELARGLDNLGIVERGLKSLDKALEYLEESNIICKKISLNNYNDSVLCQQASTLHNLGVVHRDLKNFVLAKNFFNQSLDITRKLAKKDPENYTPQLVINLNGLGALNSDFKKFIDSKSFYQEALTLSRELAKSNEEKYLPYVSDNLNNIALVEAKMGEFENAKMHYKESIKINKSLVKINPEKCLFDIADSLNNLGVLQKDLKEIEDAEKSYKEALKIRKELANKHTEVLHNVAMTLNNLAILQKDLGKFSDAEKNHMEALEIRRQFAFRNPKAFISNFADSLNNLGSLRLSMGKYKLAISALKDAVEIYDSLSIENPQTYLPQVAQTNENIGICYSKLKQFKQAKKYFLNVLNLCNQVKEQNPNEIFPIIAQTLTHLGKVQNEIGNKKEANNLFIESLKVVSEIKSSLTEENHKHLHVFKSYIEQSCELLMDNCIDTNDANQALILVENYRGIENLYLIDDKNHFPSNKNDIVVLSIQKVKKKCIFITSSKDGSCIYSINADRFLEASIKLLKNVFDIFPNFDDMDKNETKKEIFEIGKKLYNLIPSEVRNLFEGANFKYIYLSLDAYFVNIPFEFMVNDKNEFLGQQHLLPRIQGLTMLKKLNSSRQCVDFCKNKLLVSNPTSDLKHAKKEGKSIKNIISSFESLKTLKKGLATKEALLNALTDDIALFHYTGHGLEPDGLLLAHQTPIYSRDLESIKFNNNPLFFLNSCQSGITKYMGGGKYKGMQNTFLNNGVQAVISSVYPVFDSFSSEFAIEVYKNFIEGKSIGESVIRARQNKQYPWEWGLHIFHGNPELSIIFDKT